LSLSFKLAEGKQTVFLQWKLGSSDVQGGQPNPPAISPSLS